jgi:glutamine synthetase
MSDLAERLRAAGVHTLLVQFADLHGAAKGKLVPLGHLDDVLRSGAGFAGPSISGTGLPRTGARSEYYARGDVTSVTPVPWMPGVARIVGDGFVDGQPFEACPRQVLRRALVALDRRGLALQLGIEPEFFLLRREGAGWAAADPDDRLDKPSYDLKSLGRQAGFLHALHGALEACGLDVQQIDHEDAHGQYELNFAHADALTSCDRLMLFKLAAHALAEARGMVFSMMPKPFANQPGSGMHFHVSLWRDGQVDATATRGFVAGLLRHASALCALAAPTVNSYKRLTVGESLSGTTWAPAFVAHGPNNRTALVRTLPGRFEWRLPDASANPYLAVASMIAAGLEGVELNLQPAPECTEDLFVLSQQEIRARGIGLLPQSLDAALDALEADAVVSAALGPTLRAEFVRLKRAEWTEYARHVSAWELERYARAL